MKKTYELIDNNDDVCSFETTMVLLDMVSDYGIFSKSSSHEYTTDMEMASCWSESAD
jgi:hypothetical protein